MSGKWAARNLQLRRVHLLWRLSSGSRDGTKWNPTVAPMAEARTSASPFRAVEVLLSLRERPFSEWRPCAEI